MNGPATGIRTRLVLKGLLSLAVLVAPGALWAGEAPGDITSDSDIHSVEARDFDGSSTSSPSHASTPESRDGQRMAEAAMTDANRAVRDMQGAAADMEKAAIANPESRYVGLTAGPTVMAAVVAAEARAVTDKLAGLAANKAANVTDFDEARARAYDIQAHANDFAGALDGLAHSIRGGSGSLDHPNSTRFAFFDALRDAPSAFSEFLVPTAHAGGGRRINGSTARRKHLVWENTNVLHVETYELGCSNYGQHPVYRPGACTGSTHRDCEHGTKKSGRQCIIGFCDAGSFSFDLVADVLQCEVKVRSLVKVKKH